MPAHGHPTRTRRLKCRVCGSTSVKVTESQQMVKREGAKRLAADVRCRSCKHRWWSVLAVALAESRLADAHAAAGDVV